MSGFAIAGRLVGDDAPVYIVAEAGVNHDGDIHAALDLIDAAADAGADAVKFQTFDPEALVTEYAPQAAYQADRAQAASQRAMLERVRLSDAEFARLAEHAVERDVTFLSTPFDQASAQLLDALGVAAFKVGSGDLSNLPFLADVARRGRPLIVSTGMADAAEVAQAVDAVHAAGGNELALLHCVSSYPTPVEQANLRAMDALRAAHPDAVIGYSDHCLGIEISLAAVARDARILERHLTLDRSRPGPDHAVSLEPAELAELVRRVREVEAALGTGEKRPQPAERDVMVVARRSIVAARDLRAGESIDAKALVVKRPAGGMPPSRLHELIGRTVARSVARDQRLSEEDLA
jgi:N-acetylneuraminate synthase/N,N'-diacetyllegionaminate synthase